MRPRGDGAAASLALATHPIASVGVIAQLVLIVDLSALSAVAGLRNPIFFIGGLFVVVIQVTIALLAHLTRHRDWKFLTEFVRGHQPWRDKRAEVGAKVHVSLIKGSILATDFMVLIVPNRSVGQRR